MQISHWLWGNVLLHSGYSPSFPGSELVCVLVFSSSSSLPGAELALFCHCYYGQPALCLHALSPPPPPPFAYVNKNSGRSRTKTIVASEKNWKEPSPPPFPQPSQSHPLLFSVLFLFLSVSPAPVQVWEMSCEWALIWTKLKSAWRCACRAHTKST